MRNTILLLALLVASSACASAAPSVTPTSVYTASSAFSSPASAPLAIAYPGGLLAPDGKMAFVSAHGVGLFAINTSSGSVAWKREGELSALAVDRGLVVISGHRKDDGLFVVALLDALTGEERASSLPDLPRCSDFEVPSREGSLVVLRWTGRSCGGGMPVQPGGPPPSGRIAIDTAARRINEAPAAAGATAPAVDEEKAAIDAMPAAIDRASLLHYSTGLTWSRRPLRVGDRFVALTAANDELEFVWWTEAHPEALSRVKQKIGIAERFQTTTDGGYLLVRRGEGQESIVVSLLDGSVAGKVRLENTSSLAQYVSVASGLFQWGKFRKSEQGYGEDFAIVAVDADGHVIWEYPVVGVHSRNMP